MPRREPGAKDVEVKDTRRIVVDLTSKEVEHALRSWTNHHLRPVYRLPPPESFEAMMVGVSCDDDGRLISATVAYDAKRVPEPITLFEAHDWREEEGDVLWWLFPIDQAPHVGSPSGSDWPFGEDWERNGNLRWQRIQVPVIEGPDQNAFGG